MMRAVSELQSIQFPPGVLSYTDSQLLASSKVIRPTDFFSKYTTIFHLINYSLLLAF